MTVAVAEPTKEFFTFKSIKLPFTYADNKVKIGGNDIIQNIGEISVINSTLRSTLTISQTETFDDILIELITAGRDIVRVLNMSDFFNGEKQFAAMSASTLQKNLKLVTSLGLSVSTEELQVFEDYAALQAKVIEFFSGIKPQYKRVEKPGINNTPVLIDRSLDRVWTPNNNYNISIRQAENVWKHCFKAWAEGIKPPKSPTLKRDWNTHRINITDTTVSIGCQTFSRWQVEQLAEEMGWL